MDESVHNEMSGTAHGVVQARDIGTVVIGEPAARPTIPAQAAPPPSAFVDRQEHLALLRSLAEAGGRTRPGVATVHGMQGVGKTALLLQFAAMSRDLFLDGVLWVEFGPLGNAPSEAAARLLVGLGVPEQRIPSAFAQRVDMYRSMSADRRLLVLFDDVTDDGQVSALLPNSPGSMVLAASNRVLEDLHVDGAIDLALRPLSTDDGVELLRRMCGAERVDAQAEQARELVAAYEGLPLAIRVAGARLARRPDWSIDRLVDELAEAVADERTVETKVFVSFDRVYEELSEAAREMYRIVGVVIGVRIGVETLAAVAARPVREVRSTLDELARASLVEEDADERYHLHRLVRRHALRRSADVDADGTRQGWRARATRWWLFGAMAADLAADPGRLRVADPETVRGVRPDGVSAAAALDWLDREHPNLLAVVEVAATEGWHAEVCRLFEALFALYKTRKPLSAWVRVGELAVRSAAHTANPETEARCRCLLAKAFQELERFDEAHEHLSLARDLIGTVSPRFAASIQDFTGNLCLRRGDPEQALAWFQQALAINRELGLARGTALQSTLAARALGRLGRHDEALDMLAQAHALVVDTPAEVLLPKILAGQGAILVAAGRETEARDALASAVGLATAQGNTADAADALIALADLAGPEAERHRAHAVQLLERMGSPRAALLIARGDQPA